VILEGEKKEGHVEAGILQHAGHLVGAPAMPGIERPGGEGGYDER
jgi:hypothetical protein